MKSNISTNQDENIYYLSHAYKIIIKVSSELQNNERYNHIMNYHR